MGGQQPSVTVTTALCNGGQKVVPNLVDTLTPSADGTSKDVGTARTTWTSALFTGGLTTNPAGGANNLTVISQDRTAYTCMSANTSVVVTAP